MLARGTQTQALLGLNDPDVVIDGTPVFGVALIVDVCAKRENGRHRPGQAGSG